jgi:sec-independent protein translocase protein TatC
MPDPEPDGPPDDKRMTLPEHLEELRSRVTKAVIALGATLLLTMSFQEPIMMYLTWPHARAVQDLEASQQKLKVFSYPESFFTAFKMSLVAALLIASPFIIYQIWAFVRAGLYAKERRLVKSYSGLSIGLFLAGASFGFFILIPFALRMLAQYKLENVEAMFNLTDYLNLVIILTLILGLIFELPLAMHFVSRLGLISADGFSSKRRLAIVLIVVAAAILTPTGDPYTLLLVAGPMVLLYEIGILFCRYSPREPEGAVKGTADGGASPPEGRPA